MKQLLHNLRWNRYMLFIEIVGREWHGVRLWPRDAWRIATNICAPWKVER